MLGNPLLQSVCNINHPHITHTMFIPHFGADFVPPIMLGMYEVEELVLAASENLLVSYLCKGRAFAFLRHSKEVVCF